MRLSKYSDYALRVLMYAALREPALATIVEVAGDFDISRHHLVKVVHALGRAGFLATHRGVGGGFTLARSSAKIGLGDVVRLTETDESVINCKDRRNRPCRIFPVCRLKSVLGEAGAAFFTVLDRYSLEDLVKQKADMRNLLKL